MVVGLAYEVLARKWRSQTFQELVGQSHITTTLINAIKNDRLPHAMLFTGTRGTGKTSSARILAKTLCCPNVKNFVPCGVCQVCKDIAVGRSLDVIEIDGASNNGVDSIRELRESVGYMPSHGKYKIYIIDEVHMLTTSAFNALLKTLEEPPPHAIFILATTEAQKIPNTILSRCQRFDFRRISTRQIADHLAKICEAEKIEFEVEGLWVIARQADGSMRDGQSLLDQVVSFCAGDKLTHNVVVEVLGLTDRSVLLETLTSLAARDAQGILQIIEKIFRGGYDYKIFAQELLEEIRHALIARMIDPEKINLENMLDLPQTEIEALRKLTVKLSEEDLHFMFDMALKGVNDLLRAQDSRLVLEILLLRMASAPRIHDLQNLLNAKEAVANIQAHLPPPNQPQVGAPPKPSPGGPIRNYAAGIQASQNSAPPLQRPAPQPAAAPQRNSYFDQKGTQPSPTLDFQNPTELWIGFVEKIKKSNGLLGAILENTELVAIDGTVLKLGVPKKMSFLLDKLKEPDNLRRIEKFVETLWNKKFTIQAQLTGETESTSAPKVIEEKKILAEEKSIEKQIENHPLVRSTQELFKVQIKSIKEKS
jgi:DNA polymerase-3 subunit gamma/tau